MLYPILQDKVPSDWMSWKLADGARIAYVRIGSRQVTQTAYYLLGLRAEGNKEITLNIANLDDEKIWSILGNLTGDLDETLKQEDDSC